MTHSVHAVFRDAGGGRDSSQGLRDELAHWDHCARSSWSVPGVRTFYRYSSMGTYLLCMCVCVHMIMEISLYPPLHLCAHY